MFIGRTDVEAETPIFWPPDAKNWCIWKDPDVGKDWSQEEKGMTEDEMVGWHQWLNGREFGWTLGVGDEHGCLACYSPWGHKESTQLSDWTELIYTYTYMHSFYILSPNSPYWEEFLVLYSRFLLVLCFIYVCICVYVNHNLPIYPPDPHPLVTTTRGLFSTTSVTMFWK